MRTEPPVAARVSTASATTEPGAASSSSRISLFRARFAGVLRVVMGRFGGHPNRGPPDPTQTEGTRLPAPAAHLCVMGGCSSAFSITGWRHFVRWPSTAVRFAGGAPSSTWRRWDTSPARGAPPPTPSNSAYSRPGGGAGWRGGKGASAVRGESARGLCRVARGARGPAGRVTSPPARRRPNLSGGAPPLGKRRPSEEGPPAQSHRARRAPHRRARRTSRCAARWARRRRGRSARPRPGGGAAAPRRGP